MKTVSLNSRNYGPGVRSVDVPPGTLRRFVSAKIALTRENWPAGNDYVLSDGQTVGNTAVVARILRSLDGVTFQFVGEATFAGGDVILPGGAILATSDFRVSFLDAAGNPVPREGDVRVELENLVPVRTGITATLYEEGD